MDSLDIYPPEIDCIAMAIAAEIPFRGQHTFLAQLEQVVQKADEILAGGTPLIGPVRM